MKHPIALLISLIGFCQPSSAGVSEAIGQLESSDLATAKEVVKSLDLIAQEKTNPESKLAESLGREIKRSFTAEFGVQQACQKSGQEALRADELDQQGIGHLKPNALGSVNEIASIAKFKAAREARANALKQVTDSSAALTAALQDLRKQSQNSKLSEKDQQILAIVADEIEERTVKSAEVASQDMTKSINSATTKLAAQEEKEEAKVALNLRAEALSAMRKAIKTRKSSDEAKAMQLLSRDAPDCVKDYTDYIAARSARFSAAADSESTRKINELETRLNRVGVPRWP